MSPSCGEGAVLGAERDSKNRRGVEGGDSVVSSTSMGQHEILLARAVKEQLELRLI